MQTIKTFIVLSIVSFGSKDIAKKKIGACLPNGSTVRAEFDFIGNLREEIKTYDPDVIITIGARALHRFNGEKSLGRDSLKPFYTRWTKSAIIGLGDVINGDNSAEELASLEKVLGELL